MIQEKQVFLEEFLSYAKENGLGHAFERIDFFEKRFRFFPKGMIDILHALGCLMDQHIMLLPLDQMRTTEKVHFLVMSGFFFLQPYRALIKEGLLDQLRSQLLFLKDMQVFAYQRSSAVWSNIATDIDFSFYTKRISLTLVYNFAFFSFLQDETEELEKCSKTLSEKLRFFAAKKRA